MHLTDRPKQVFIAPTLLGQVMLHRFAVAFLLLLSVSVATPASAQALGGLELRGGIYGHSVDGADGVHLNRIEDVNFEALFSLPQLDSFIWLGQVRPHVGATINMGGRESMAYAGLSWTVPLGSTFFVEGAFGGAIHNGELHNAVDPMRSLGCPVLFHESVSLGANLTSNASIMVTAEHASHAGLCGPDNRGLTNVGVRLGFKF